MNKRNYPKLLTPPAHQGWAIWGAFAVSGLLWGGIAWGAYTAYNALF